MEKIKILLQNNALILSYCIPCCFVLCYFIFMCVWGPSLIRFVGESDDYLLLSVALEKNFSDIVSPEVIAQAQLDFPGLPWNEWIREFEKGALHLPLTVNNNSYSWYFVTYPLLCLPAKFLLKAAGIHQIFAFYLTNLLLLLFSVLISLKWMKELIFCKNSYASLLLLSVNLPYLFWASNEICLMSCMTLANSALFSKRYIYSALFTGLATTLNVTAILFFIFVWLKFFYRNSEFLSFKPSVLRQCMINLGTEYKKTFVFILFTIIGFIPILINLIRWNKIAVMQNMGSINGSTERFLAYVFDLNFGILPYYPFVLLIFIMLLFVLKKEYLIYFITVCSIIFSFSLMLNIDCGMSFMSRYLAWTMPLILIGVFYYTRKYLLKCKILKAGKIFLWLSLCYSIIIIISYIPRHNFLVSDCIFHHPIAKRVFDLCPALYNPRYSTFNSRTNHIPGGYDIAQYVPIEYIDKNGNIRKVLVETCFIEPYLDYEIVFSPDLISDVENERRKAHNNHKKYQYLNFPKGVKKKMEK